MPYAGLPDALERLQQAGVLSQHDQAPLPPAAIEPLVLALEANFDWRVRVSLYSTALRVSWYMQPVWEAQRRAAAPSP